MSADKNVQQLLRQGIEAAREGKKAEARKLFEQVVKLDDGNEKAYLWLASLVDNNDERREHLEKVLAINPNNEKAQKALQQLGPSTKKSDEPEVIPGVTRRQLTLIAGGGGAVILLLLVAFTLFNNNRNAQLAAEQAAIASTINAQTAAVISTMTEVANQTATQAALVTATPTLTPTSARATLPPTFTPEASATPLVSPTPLPAPSGVGGRIIGSGGHDISQTGFLPIVIYDVNSGQSTAVSDSTGRNPDISIDGSRVVYTRYFPVTFDFGLELINSNGSDPTVITDGQPVLQAQMPSLCQTLNQVAFVAVPTGGGREIDFSNQTEPAYQVLILNLDNKQLTRLTNDKVTYTYPVFSPDCTKIAVVRNDANGVNKGADIVVIDVTTLVQTPVTNDLDTFTESAPRWSPDGRELVYAAAPKNDPNNSDIVTRASDGSGTPLVPIHTPANDIFPVFSPDGKYIAFASNPNGYYDIFILDRVKNELYQLTNSEDEDYPGAWVP